MIGRQAAMRAMRTVVSVVMVMSCVMMVQADVKPQRDFNLQRFAGRWYRVGLAYDSPSFIPFRDKLKASMGIITPLTNGNVNLTMFDATPHGCLSKLYQYEKTNVPGQFTYFSSRSQMDSRMQEAVSLVSLLVLGSAWTLQGVHVLPETLVLTQANFDLDQFMGRWYEVAVVSTCPHYMKRFGADIDSYVVQTNYDEYAMMLLLGTEKPSGKESITAKLYTRTTDVTPVVLDKFTHLVTQLGMKLFIMNPNTTNPPTPLHLTIFPGECVPGESEKEPTNQPQVQCLRHKSPQRRVSGQVAKMQKVILVLLVLGWTWTIEGVPVLPEPLYSTQENFELDRFLGTWYDVALATSCPHVQRYKGEMAIGKTVLQKSSSDNKLTLTKTGLRRGTCREYSGEYELTDIPGRFLYLSKYGSEVDSYVVHTNYDEYAIMIMSKQMSSGEKSTSMKLYSRTRSVRTSLLEDFKTLVTQEGMSNETIFIKQDKGECVPGEEVEQAPAHREPQRVRRQVVEMPLVMADEGSGEPEPDFMDFKGTEACGAPPETGPCFGMHQRYYYNATSLSCQLFNYGGCLGNQNNFKTERDCLQKCRTEAVCRLPMAAEPCTGQPSIWAFDSSAGLCVAYKQGFCQTNSNKFYTKAECEEYCGVVKDDGDLLEAN
ncbi:hypothetical protein INR49_015155 [Caranx melampygus]|nr:hypothetical protein INR49_015155 [Caranx melampygus]